MDSREVRAADLKVGDLVSNPIAGRALPVSGVIVHGNGYTLVSFDTGEDIGMDVGFEDDYTVTVLPGGVG